MRRSETHARSRRTFGLDCSEDGLGRNQNGALLALAEKEFEAFVTVDRQIAVEQDLRKFKILVILLRARTNRLEDIRPLATELLKKLPSATAGELTIIGT